MTKVQRRVVTEAKRLFGWASWTPYQVGAKMTTIEALVAANVIVRVPSKRLGTIFSPTTTLRYRLR